ISTEAACDKPKGIVCSQSPAGGSTAELGSVVNLSVSNGKSPKAKVPNVLGSSRGTAVAAIQAAGFVPVITTVRVKDPSRDNIVLSQDPPGGAQRKPGTHVTIVVGKFGPQPTPTPTP